MSISEPIPTNNFDRRGEAQETWRQGRASYIHEDQSKRDSWFCTGPLCHCTKQKGLLKHSQQQLEEAEQYIEALRQGSIEGQKVAEDKQKHTDSTIEGLKITIFGRWKFEKEYEEAERIYRDILTNAPTDAPPSEPILGLRYNYAEMLIEQGKFGEAERVAEEVWQEWKARDPLSEAYKRSHRQICAVYCSLGRYGKAESMHRLVYHEGPKDEWALENGDEVCKQLAKRGEYDKAQLAQLDVWEERRQSHNQGPRHKLTIGSALARISMLESHATMLADQAGSEEEKDHNLYRKRCCEYEIDKMLQAIWGAKEVPELVTDILDVGHKLACRLVKQEKYPQAVVILEDVWGGKERTLGETNQSTMSAGRLLADALRLQGSVETCQRAEVMYRKILATMKSVLGESDDGTTSVGADLAQALCYLGNWAGAEGIYHWMLGQTLLKHGPTDPKTLDTRYNLGYTMYKQGARKYGEAEETLRGVYDEWFKQAPKDPMTVNCGQMLVKTLERQMAGLDVVMPAIQGLFEGRDAIPDKDILYLEIGRLYGKNLLENQEIGQAQKVLKSLWSYQPESDEEKKAHIRCGHVYGQSLYENQKYGSAKEVLESVVNAQTLGDSEAGKALQLLERAKRKAKRGSHR